jgi:hypothetical protein
LWAAVAGERPRTNPGSGTNAKGDSLQEVFLVTDGVEDELSNGSRVQSLMSTSWCKNRGIRTR